MSSNTTEFVIKVKMQDRWIPHFLSMLKYMEYCGNIGHSERVGLYADGDGEFQPKFEWLKSLPDKAEPMFKSDRDRIYDAG